MFNITLINTVGEKGVAAFTAINYLHFVLMACIIGMSEGIRSIISYNHGMGNPERIRATLKLAARVTAVFAVVTFSSFAFFGRELVSSFFSTQESDIITLAANGTAILAFAYLFNGFNILIAGYFTSIGTGQTLARHLASARLRPVDRPALHPPPTTGHRRHLGNRSGGRSAHPVRCRPDVFEA